MKSYFDLTINSKNPLARFAHTKRTKNPLKLFNKKSGSILDFGCANGEFIKTVKLNNKEIDTYGYEPNMNTSNSRIFKTWDDVIKHVEAKNKFDVISCF